MNSSTASAPAPLPPCYTVPVLHKLLAPSLCLATLLLAACGGSTPTASPSPINNTPDCSSGSVDSRATCYESQMTQAQKLQLVTGDSSAGTMGGAGFIPGIPSLGIPDLNFVDGSVGVGNGLGPATALPSSIASAATWDTNEAYKYGTVIGKEMRAYGADVNLGGNVNLTAGREPRDGRTFETKGEDPLLAGAITVAHLQGIEDQHVIAGIKHFALNDQESGRTTANVIIDERAMRESDLLAFEIGVKQSGVQSVMCAYNLVNGVYSCENSHLLTDILKTSWGFPGFVMSDWWATHSTAAAANAGLDQEQPNNTYFSQLGAAISSGTVPQTRLDDMVHRILHAMIANGVIDNPPSKGTLDVAGDEAIAQEEEEQGAVLLQNNNTQLPLNAAALHNIAVIGSHADVGVLSGGGSAQVQPIGGAALSFKPLCPPCWGGQIWDPSSPLKAIQAAAPGATVSFNDGSDPTAAATLAAGADVAIVFVSNWESEGMDLPDLDFDDDPAAGISGQDALVSAVAAANPHTVVVVESGGAQIMPWLNQVNAVLEAWYPGQEGGPAIANLLFGVVNPSGKLPITFPASVSQLPRPQIPQPPDSSTPFNVNYTEGYNVGYKWFDSQNLTPLFPFGFGLSYTTFSFSNATLTNNLSGSNPNIQISFNLQNTGSVAGAEVAQVYLQMPAALNEAPRRLIGWLKVSLNPGQTQSETIEVDENTAAHPLSYWDPTSQQWQLGSGTYNVYLGDSSRNTTLVGTFQAP